MWQLAGRGPCAHYGGLGSAWSAAGWQRPRRCKEAGACVHALSCTDAVLAHRKAFLQEPRTACRRGWLSSQMLPSLSLLSRTLSHCYICQHGRGTARTEHGLSSVQPGPVGGVSLPGVHRQSSKGIWHVTWKSCCGHFICPPSFFGHNPEAVRGRRAVGRAARGRGRDARRVQRGLSPISTERRVSSRCRGPEKHVESGRMTSGSC